MFGICAWGIVIGERGMWMSNANMQNDIPTDENNVLVAVAESFIEWREKLYKEMRGGKLMFDVPKNYKWLDENELFTYYVAQRLSAWLSAPI